MGDAVTQGASSSGEALRGPSRPTLLARARRALRLSGLRTQILLPLALLTLLLTATAVYVGQARIQAAAERSVHEWAGVLVDAAAAASLEHVRRGELERLEHTLGLLVALPEVHLIELSDPQGRAVIALNDVHAHASDPHSHGLLPDGALPDGALPDRALQIRRGEPGGLLDRYSDPNPRILMHNGHRVLWISRPLSAQSPAGRIGLALDLEHREAAGRSILYQQIGLGVALSLVFLWLVYRVVGRILAPLGRLAGHLRGVSNSRPQPWNEAGNCREVQDIARATNGMLSRLAQQIAALTSSQSMLSATIDGSPYCVIVTDAQFRVSTINAAARRQFGVAAPQSELLSLRQLLPHLQQDVFQPSVLSDWLEEGQGARTFVSLGMRLNGQSFDAEVSVARVDTDVAPEYVFVLRDITAESRARTALLERTARLNTVLSLSAEGIVFFDREQRLSYINPAMLELLQPLRMDQLMGSTLVQFESTLVDKSLPEQPYQPRAVQADGRWRVRTDGPAPPFTLLGAGERILTCTWRQAGAEHDELVVFFRDVTQQVTLDRMKSEFLSSAAHELRTPLTSILGFSDLMIQYPMPEAERLDLLKTIRSQSALLVNIINEMLDLSRIEARRGMDFKPQHCLLAQLCQDAASGMSMPGDDRVVQVVHEDARLVVWVDPDKFRQVLNNLLSNAYKFSAGQGDIALRTGLAWVDGKRWARIEVQDHGIGMTPEQAAHAFERFYRADVSGHIAGTGLGLPLVKEIVELSGGRVQLFTEAGLGTRVELLLPLPSEALAGPVPPT